MIITWDDISKLNKMVEEKKLDYKIHLSDSCRGQSMWIESLGEKSNTDEIETLSKLINDYFKIINTEIEFSWDKKSFWTKDRSLIF